MASSCRVRPRYRRWLASALLLTAQAVAANPVWFVADADERWRPTAAANQAVELLTRAEDQGLNPADYQAKALHQAVATPAPLSGAQASDLDARLSVAVQRYLDDVHQGRANPQSLHPTLRIERPLALPADTAAQAAQVHQLAQVVQASEPPLPQYAALRDMLQQYRALGNHPAWSQALPTAPAKLAVGQAWSGLPRLTERLIALGDLPAGTPAPTKFTQTLRDGVQAFQRRHGLAVDGQPGPATLAALAVTPAQRAEQIALNLERLRWMAAPLAQRLIAVNLPEFMLRAYVQQDGGYAEQLAMRVIIGRALDTSTPLLSEELKSIEFSPYWNIPPSIARQETIPRLRRDPGYLNRAQLEFVGAGGEVTRRVSAAQLNAVLAGKARIRQRPGPHNALGDIKFILPNNQNIYLHHTPSVGLFERTRRDFSHGCIRVEEPVALAQFVLADDPLWTEARIRKAMDSGKSNFTRVPTPFPVLLTYQTARVEDGKVFFFADIYGFDRSLATELHKISSARQVAPAASGKPASVLRQSRKAPVRTAEPAA